MNGTHNIIVSIIENTANPHDAANMLVRMFGVAEEGDPPPAKARATEAAATPKAKRVPRKLRSGAVMPDASAIVPSAYYSVDVMRQHTRYGPNHIFAMIREQRVISKLEGNRRLILGSEILRIRAEREQERALGTNGRQAANGPVV